MWSLKLESLSASLVVSYFGVTGYFEERVNVGFTQWMGDLAPLDFSSFIFHMKKLNYTRYFVVVVLRRLRKVLPYCLCWPETCYIDGADLKLAVIVLLLPGKY